MTAPKRRLTDAEVDALALKHGIKKLPRDHPIFSQGAFFTVSSRTSAPSPQKDTPSTPTSSPSDSGSGSASET